jgi:hypothetical protein
VVTLGVHFQRTVIAKYVLAGIPKASTWKIGLEANIKTNLKELERECVGWIHLAQDMYILLTFYTVRFCVAVV